MQRLFGRFAFFAIIFLYSMIGYSQVLITSTGTLNNFIVNYPANITGLQSGMEITFFSNQTITNSPSLNINTTGLRPIFKNVNQSLSNGEIKAGQAVTVVFDGTNWQLMSTVSPSTATGFWSTLGNVSDSSAYFIGTTNTEPLIFKTSSLERMRISRAGRFGFNMNPTAASMFNIKSIGNGAILTVNRSTDSGALIELTETGGGNARIDMYTSANSNVVQIPSGPGNIFFAGGGNLGVNTTAPGNTLHVAGGARIGNLTNAGIVFSNNNGDLFTTSTSGILSGIGTADQVAWFTNTSSVTSSNNLTFTSSKSQLIVGINNNNNASNTYGLVIGQANTIAGGRSFVSGVSNTVNNGQTAAIGEGLFSNGRSGMVVGGYNPNVPVALNNFNNAFEVGVGTAPSNSIFGFVVKYLGISPGIVGIGTDNPQNTLHIVGGARIGNLSSTGNYFVQTNSAGDLFISTNTGQSAFWALGANSVPGIRTIGTTNNFDLPIIANNLERMRIRSNGNIGINTSVAGVLLEIRGLGTSFGTAFRVLNSVGNVTLGVNDDGNLGVGTSGVSGNKIYVNIPTTDPNNPIGIQVYNDYAGSSGKFGIYNSVTGNGSGAKYGIYNYLLGLAGDNSANYGTYNSVAPAGTGSAYGHYSFISPIGTGVRYGSYIDVNSLSTNTVASYGNYLIMDHDGPGNSYAYYSNSIGSGSGFEYGVYTVGEDFNYFSSRVGIGVTTNAGARLYVQIPVSNTTENYGFYNDQKYSGISDKYGIYNFVTGDGTGKKYGIYNDIDGKASDPDQNYAIYNAMAPSGSGAAYGVFTTISTVGTGLRYGNYVSITASAQNINDIYGCYSGLTHNGTSTSANAYLYRGAISGSAGGTDYGVYVSGEDINFFSGKVYIADISPPNTVTASGLYVYSSSSGQSVAAFNRAADGTVVSIMSANTQEGSISVSGTTVSYNAFTGSHFISPIGAKPNRGELVSFTKEREYYHNNPTSEIVYKTTITNKPNDPKVIGAYLSLLDPNTNESEENPHLVMAVGNGEMWVVDYGQDLTPGDYLISSSIAGHAMKENGEFEIAYIIGRVAESVNWSDVDEKINGKKHKKIAVLFENFVINNKANQLEEQMKEIQGQMDYLKSEIKRINELLGTETRK